MLHRRFNFVGDFFLDLGGGCAGVGRRDQRVLDREFGIFEAPHVVVGLEAGKYHYDGQDERRRPVIETKLGDLH